MIHVDGAAVAWLSSVWRRGFSNSLNEMNQLGLICGFGSAPVHALNFNIFLCFQNAGFATLSSHKAIFLLLPLSPASRSYMTKTQSFVIPIFNIQVVAKRGRKTKSTVAHQLCELPFIAYATN